MASDPTTAPPAPAASSPPTLPTAPANPDDLGLDRAFWMGLAQIPVIAILWTLAAYLGCLLVDHYGWHLIRNMTTSGVTTEVHLNLAPIAVICAGMLLAAFIDGYYFKVPNWCTLSLVVSGWYVGILHDFGSTEIYGFGGFGSAFGGTMCGFALLFPALFIGGMGEGDVKMTMGFGSWICVFFGFKAGIEILFWSFALGVIIGGVFGLLIMILRRQFGTNASNFSAIMTDLKVLVTQGPGKAAERANSRRKDWVRLPYGVPLCVGFLGYLVYIFI